MKISSRETECGGEDWSASRRTRQAAVSPAPFGYVIRALADRDRTLTELAALLGVSKQAAIKVVDEMQRHKLLSVTPIPRTGA